MEEFGGYSGILCVIEVAARVNHLAIPSLPSTLINMYVLAMSKRRSISLFVLSLCPVTFAPTDLGYLN